MIPMNRCDTVVVGVEAKKISDYIADVVRYIEKMNPADEKEETGC